MTDQTLTTGRSLSEFTAQLASAQPAPGGGGAAALAGALAASLAAMAANVTAANPRYTDRTTRSPRWPPAATRSARRCSRSSTRTRRAFCRCSGPTPSRRTTPHAPPGSRTRRTRRALPRWAMLEHCEQVALLLPAALSTASPLLRSDVGCAAALCRAAAEAAELNVLVNTGLLAPDDRAATEARAARLRATVVQCCAQTADAVRAALRGEG